MLRTRVLTAAVLLPLAWALIFWLPEPGFAAVAGVVILLASAEFRRLASLPPATGWALLVLQAGLLIAAALTRERWSDDPAPLFALACLAWLVMFAQLYLHRPPVPVDGVYRTRGFLNAIGSLTLAWLALAWLRFEPSGEWWILLLLLAIWSSDIGAYFSGRAFGRRRLAPRISPGKTWAGLVGGLLVAALVPPLAALWLPGIDAPWLVLAALGVVTALASVGGDLFISLHKRSVGIKDTGRLLPGHGGVLDRLDSLIAGAPFFALGKVLAGL